MNRNYLEDFVEEQLEQQSIFREGLSSGVSNLTFTECAIRCRGLVEGGFSNWGVPSVEQLSQFVGVLNDNTLLWTVTGTSSHYAYSYDDPDPYTERSLFIGRFTMRLNTGRLGRAERDDDRGCRCVR